MSGGLPKQVAGNVGYQLHVTIRCVNINYVWMSVRKLENWNDLWQCEGNVNGKRCFLLLIFSTGNVYAQTGIFISPAVRISCLRMEWMKSYLLKWYQLCLEENCSTWGAFKDWNMLYIFDCTFVVMMVHLWLVKMDEESNTFVYEKKMMILIQKKSLLTVDHQRLTKSLISSNKVWDVELMKFC